MEYFLLILICIILFIIALFLNPMSDFRFAEPKYIEDLFIEILKTKLNKGEK